ncbi:Mth938-like domain-containing protein [Poseidonocella sedimentorum]|uniref:Uncharacterized conserved protein, contains Mth938-like domain n=1 Tax=Poseidonocella sedimentorum TaxID=871652 RepID=A0A1I6DZG3_9RHOB|nr:Mth938-like domain-containing protein [Poseidonocella sedimentorum]SFR10889.1 Uncharacterized conserved protein, contains Mth938-like domain [Poseidonocella sedimentorum]
MRLSETHFPQGQPVDGYAPGAFRVGGAVISGPLLLGPSGPRAWSGLADHAPLLALAAEADILLLGIGAESGPPPRALQDALEATGLGVEDMATPPACRTYNVLLAEGRRVALAALPV